MAMSTAASIADTRGRSNQCDGTNTLDIRPTSSASVSRAKHFDDRRLENALDGVVSFRREVDVHTSVETLPLALFRAQSVEQIECPETVRRQRGAEQPVRLLEIDGR